MTPPQPTDPEQIEFYENVKATNRANECTYGQGNKDTLNADFTFEEVEKIVKAAKNGKAPGIDGLIVDVMKNEISIRILTTPFNKCLRLQLMPSIWAKVVINPIPKSPDNNPRVPPNYRGISLLPVTSKLYTAAISHRLSEFFEENNSLSNERNSFHPKRSCVDHIFTLRNLCKIRKNLRHDTFLTSIDFKKAFDHVNHEMLLYKLHNMGRTRDLYNSIKNIYQKPLSCVQLDGHLTNWFPITSGIRQGDSLSLTLFAAFINDLSVEMNELNVGVKIGGETMNMLLYFRAITQKVLQLSTSYLVYIAFPYAPGEPYCFGVVTSIFKVTEVNSDSLCRRPSDIVRPLIEMSCWPLVLSDILNHNVR